MHRDFRNIVKVASIYTTTIIGAGFASGQEIIKFFTRYYSNGFYGIILAGIFFSVIGLIVLDKVYRDRIRNYNEFLYPVVGWKTGKIMETVITLFMFSLLCIMTAGMGNIIRVVFNIPVLYALILASIICMIAIIFDIRGIVTISTVITPFLIIGIISVGFYIILFRDVTVFSSMELFGNIYNNWIASSLIYVSYNSIMSVIIMCNLFPYLKTRKVGIIGGFMGGVMLMFLAFILNTAIYRFYPHGTRGEFPILDILGKYSVSITEVYTFVLFLSMFTTAINSGFCLVKRVKSSIKIGSKLLTVIICILTIPLAGLGFSELIITVYPVFGYVGLFMIIIILINGIQYLFRKKNITRKMSL